MAIDGAEAGAWVAAFAAAGALGKQVYDALRHRKKEQNAIEEALDRQPLVRQQLELGNVGEAVKQLNLIIEIQAEHITTQNEQIKGQTTELKAQAEEIKLLRAEVEKLRALLEDADKPSSGG